MTEETFCIIDSFDAAFEEAESGTMLVGLSRYDFLEISMLNALNLVDEANAYQGKATRLREERKTNTT